MSSRKRPSSCARWTAAEDATLLREWHDTLSARALRAKLPGRSWMAIHWRATRALGLPAGIPQGHESLRACSRRTGFDRDQLLRIFAAAGVPVIRYYGASERADHRGRRLVPAHPWCCINREAATTAVEAHLAHRTETASDAARRHGVPIPTLAYWLRTAGIRGRLGSPMRLDPATVDRIVADRAPAWKPRNTRTERTC